MRSRFTSLRRLISRWRFVITQQCTPQQLALIPLCLFLLLLILLGNSHQQPDVALIQTRLNEAQPTETNRVPPLEPAQAEINPTDINSKIHESEIRGVWITNVASSVMFAPWGIPRAVRQLAKMNFNTVYPVVWNRGKSFYHSDTLKRLTGNAIAPMISLTHPTEDPLAEMLRTGHQQNLRIIPWFEYGFMVPLGSKLATQHPDWLTARQNGSHELHESNLTGNRQSKATFLSRLLGSGAPKSLGWLNPLHPEVQTLISALVQEVISQYDVEGIQFDDHFSLPADFGYDPYTVALYQAEHDGQLPPNRSDNADWLRWRADKFSQFVGTLHDQVKATCPTCLFSLSPNPANFAYRFHLQDWRTWVANDWIDELVVQVYRDELDSFEGELAKETLQSTMDRIPVSIGILTGTWRRPISFEQIRQQVVSSRDHHFSGVSFFYWDTLWSYFTPESPQKRRQNFRELLADKPL